MSQLKPYPEYKDSGIEWIGEIPEDWEVQPLFTLLKEIKNKNENNRVSNVLSLSYGKIIRRDVSNNFGLIPQSYDNYNIVDKGDIILRLTDLQNDKRSLRVGYVKEKGIITSAYVSLRSKHGDKTSKFHYYFLHSLDLLKVFYGLGDGVRQTMGFKDLKRLNIIVPQPSELRGVCKFLGKKTSQIDSLIADKERLIQLLKEKRQAMITETVTKGLDPNVKMKDSGVEWIGEIPEHWTVANLKYQSDIIMGQSIDSDDISFNTNDLPFLQGNADFSELYPTPRNYCNKGKKHAKEGDILLSVRAPVGALNIPDQHYAIGRGLSAIRVSSDYNSYYWFALKVFKKELHSKMTGSTFEAVTIEDVKNLTFLNPSREEMILIGKELGMYDKEVNQTIHNIQIQISKLKEYRESLIYEAVTGKIDLRDYESEDTSYSHYEIAAEAKESYESKV